MNSGTTSSSIKKIYRIRTKGLLIIFLTFVLAFSGKSQYQLKLNTGNDKKALIHYMGWYGEGQSGRHWEYGHAQTPLMGYYDSRNWSVLTYHMLLSWAYGIDGVIINIKDYYDDECLNSLVSTINMLYNIDSINFNYTFSISYDDQGLSDEATAVSKFTYLRDHILQKTNSFLYYDNVPAIFTFNYPGQYLSSQNYSNALNSVFPDSKPKLIWNQIEESAETYVNSFFPWVGPDASGWDYVNGLEWGQNYLAWFYPTANNYSIEFICGGVWPGFDDRPNTSWGENRWMERVNGEVYNSTWEFVNNYSGAMPLNWVVIETWNDWNEGTQIEPSIENGSFYLELTTDNINIFKGTGIRKDAWKSEVAYLIYQLGDLIERHQIDSATYFPVFTNAVSSFLQKGRDDLEYISDDIVDVDSIRSIIEITSTAMVNNDNKIQLFPNPVKNKLTIKFQPDYYNLATLQILNSEGKTIVQIPITRQNETIDVSGFLTGIYLVMIVGNSGVFTRKIIIE